MKPSIIVDDNKLEDDFDLEQAQKLLESIRYMGDLRKFPIQKPNSITMELGTMLDWVKWYAKTTDWNGRDGTENEVMKMIGNLDSDLQILVKRVEEGFRRLLNVVESREIRIQLLNSRIEILKEEIKMINEQKPKLIEEKIQVEDDESENVLEPVEKVIEQPQKPKIPVRKLL